MKIAVITCVNNEEEYAQALSYIDRLHVPDGYELDVIAVREAPSMAAGYQMAMEHTDARYKIYMHQDTFIINREFLRDMLSVFRSDDRIGTIGMVGCDDVPINAQAVAAWNVGCVYHNCIPARVQYTQRADRQPVDVEAVDGLLLATQHDVRWREDLFDGWDFYDISECFEMRRAGYRVVVPYQESPWCYHDNTYSKMLNYYKYCERAVGEYQDIKPFVAGGVSARRREYDRLREESREELKRLVNAGNQGELIEIFSDPDNRGYLHLREYEILADIARGEQAEGGMRFWQAGETYEELVQKINDLKYRLKRMEFGADQGKPDILYILKNYSICAIKTVAAAYEVVDERVWKQLTENM